MRRASPPLPHRRGRLEIVPLIDIMFFLLAAFMVVSIGKIHLKSLKLSLPTDQSVTQKEAKEDFINIAVTADGEVQLGKEVLANKDLLVPRLQDLYAKNQDQKFLISADKEARHGDVVAVLAKLRAAGFQKVGFSIGDDKKVPSDAPGISPPESAPQAATQSQTTPVAPTLSSPQLTAQPPQNPSPAVTQTPNSPQPATQAQSNPQSVTQTLPDSKPKSSTN